MVLSRTSSYPVVTTESLACGPTPIPWWLPPRALHSPMKWAPPPRTKRVVTTSPTAQKMVVATTLHYRLNGECHSARKRVVTTSPAAQTPKHQNASSGGTATALPACLVPLVPPVQLWGSTRGGLLAFEIDILSCFIAKFKKTSKLHIKTYVACLR